MIPGLCKCELIWEKGLCRCDSVQDLEVRSFWVIQVDPKYHLYQGEAETHSRHTEKEIRAQGQSLGWCSYKPQNARKCQQPPEAGRGLDRFSLESPEGVQPCPYLDFQRLASRTGEG